MEVVELATVIVGVVVVDLEVDGASVEVVWASASMAEFCSKFWAVVAAVEAEEEEDVVEVHFLMTEVDGVVAATAALEERSFTGWIVETIWAVVLVEVEEVVAGIVEVVVAGEEVSTSTEEVKVASVAISSVVDVTWLFSRVIAFTRVVVYEDVLTTTVAGLIVLVMTA